MYILFVGSRFNIQPLLKTIILNFIGVVCSFCSNTNFICIFIISIYGIYLNHFKGLSYPTNSSVGLWGTMCNWIPKPLYLYFSVSHQNKFIISHPSFNLVLLAKLWTERLIKNKSYLKLYMAYFVRVKCGKDFFVLLFTLYKDITFLLIYTQSKWILIKY